ncbi:MAG TPA: hypothetical protein VFM55_05615 [Micromonosporaceae bacterium]|nr:hypothetical protein [Micromonosporaceae bacterium]
MSQATFGQQPTYASTDDFDIAVSEDKRAFTLTFTNMLAAVDAGTLPEPVATRTFSFVMPLESAPDTVQISFVVSGFALASKAANGYAVLSVNGRTGVLEFPSGTEQEFVLELELEAEPTSECRISLFLLAERELADPLAGATVSALNIDADVLPRPV